MSYPNTAELLEQIRGMPTGQVFHPSIFQPRGCGINAHVSAAIRAAKHSGLIVIAYFNDAGKPNYRRTEAGMTEERAKILKGFVAENFPSHE